MMHQQISEWLTPIKAIRAKCLECVCGLPKEIRLCSCTECPLYPYRMGHRPKVGTDIPLAVTAENHAESLYFFSKGNQKESPLV